MLVLHGSWVEGAAPLPSRFALWAEVPPQRATAGRRRSRPPAGKGPVPNHPFGATKSELLEALGALDDRTLAEAASSGWGGVNLPSIGGRPLLSPEAAGGDSPAASEGSQGVTLSWWRLPVLEFEAVPAARLVLALATAAASPGLVLGDDLHFWVVATRFALELLCRQRVLPRLERHEELYFTHWRPLLSEEVDGQRFGQLARAMPPACRALALEPLEPPAAGAAPPGPRHLLQAYLGAIADGVARQAAREVGIPRATAGRARRVARRSMAEAWWAALCTAPLVDGTADSLRAFYEQYRAWMERDPATQATDTFRVCFRLDPPAAPASAAPAPGQPGTIPWSLSYLLQATDDPSLLVPAADAWRQQGATARFLNRRLEQPQERLLAGLGKAARLFPPIETSLRTARPEVCPLSATDAHRFLREAALVLKSSGFGVLVPGLESKLRLRVALGRRSGDKGASAGQAMFGWDSVVAFDWQVAVGDETLTREEFEELARLKEPLVQVRGQWVELDPAQVEQALAFFERWPDGGEMPLPEALKLALSPDGQAGLPIAGVDTAGWIDDLLYQLRQGRPRQVVGEPPGFTGQLRPYQKVGLSWLSALRRFGIGACLADDMGLGKTIQLIALLLHARRREEERRRPKKDGGVTSIPDVPEPTPRPALLICPTSVVGNWQRELARFGPSLRVLVHHGAGRAKETLAADAPGHDVVISTYALLHRDEATLLDVEWGEVVLDEARNVKNASTKAAQAARRLRCRWRAALTGTPVENRLTELWSIFQFLNPGYLGSAEDFRRSFARPIERANDAEATQRLKALVSPFILRRVKTDRAVIRDLPEKNEMKVFCTLTEEQATLYEAVVRDAIGQIEGSEGITRRGLILATLTKLKQVCNHPALFMHDGSTLPGRSGKLARLTEMLEEVLAVDDRALIFTQYAEMGRLLKGHLESQLGGTVLFLHGGTPATERDRMVARFQQDRRAPHLFVLSLKAGGTGLNLTAANHVFHFDRWWNPAVENQATDRAFRIGQQRNVQVHKFLCAGTFEETVDQLIERKVALSQAIVGTGETWITEMSTVELRDLFALRRDAVQEATLEPAATAEKGRRR